MLQRGKYFWENGNRYEGDWLDGKRAGKGKERKKLILVFDSSIKIGKFFFASNGSTYEGDFIEGMQTGKGKE